MNRDVHLFLVVLLVAATLLLGLYVHGRDRAAQRHAEYVEMTHKTMFEAACVGVLGEKFRQKCRDDWDQVDAE